MKRALILVVLALLLTGCETQKYDTYESECVVNDGRSEITLYVKHDKDQPPDSPQVRQAFEDACARLRAAGPWKDSKVDR